ncbi:MAG: LamG-like jellyroll fold domain-containing protein [Pseudomonadota bacterium]
MKSASMVRLVLVLTMALAGSGEQCEQGWLPPGPAQDLPAPVVTGALQRAEAPRLSGRRVGSGAPKVAVAEALVLPGSPPRAPSGQSLRCDGIDGMQLDLDAALDGTQALSVEFWFRPAAVGDLGSRPVDLLVAPRRDTREDDFHVELGDGVGRTYRTVSFKSHRLREGQVNGGRGMGWLHPVEPGTWHHLAASVETQPDGVVRTNLYIDGERATAGGQWPAGEGVAHAVDSLWLCRSPQGDTGLRTPFLGEIDEVHISKVVRHRQSFVPGPVVRDADTVLWLDFD